MYVSSMELTAVILTMYYLTTSTEVQKSNWFEGSMCVYSSGDLQLLCPSVRNMAGDLPHWVLISLEYLLGPNYFMIVLVTAR